MLLAQNNHTPYTDWIGMPLRELPRLIETNNEIIEERRQARDMMRKRQRRR